MDATNAKVVGFIKLKDKASSSLFGGKSKGGDPRGAPCLHVLMESEIPDDAGKGKEYAAVKLRPVQIIRERDATTLRLWRAHWTREVLPEVTLELLGRDDTTQSTILLKEARVIYARAVTGDTSSWLPGQWNGLDCFGIEGKVTEYAFKEGGKDATASYERRVES